MNILFTTHSLIRWLIVGIALIAVIKFMLGWLQNRQFDRVDRGLSSGYSGLMDLQILLGLALFFWDGFSRSGFPRFRLEHMVMMIAAGIVAHLPSIWKTDQGRTRYLNGLLAVLGSLILLALGISLLPGGPARWAMPW